MVGLAGLELGYLVFVTSGNLLLALGFLAALALVVGLARFEIGDLLFITGTLLLALLGTLALVMPLLEGGQGPGGCNKRDQRSLVLVSGMLSWKAVGCIDRLTTRTRPVEGSSKLATVDEATRPVKMSLANEGVCILKESKSCWPAAE